MAHPNSYLTVEERFWSKVRVLGVDECWLWTAGTTSNGYGAFWLNGKHKRAHSIAWKFYNGDLPPDKPYVLHHCDTPACVNPRHLYAGTQQDNVNDMMRRGRQAPTELKRHLGEKNGRAKLTEDKVREIRVLYASGEFSYRALGKRFGVSCQLVSQIVNYKIWTHI